MTEPAGLRERRKRETRSGLASAALSLAVERGTEAVTIEDIAAAAGVSTRTFFNYFPSKEQAFISDDLERCRVLLEGFQQAPASDDVWQTLSSVVVDVLSTINLPERERALKHRLIRTSAAVVGELFMQYSSLEAQIAVEIARRLGLPAGHVLPTLMASSFTGATRGATHRWLAAQPPVDYPPLLAEALDLLAPAFSPAMIRSILAGERAAA